MMGGALHGEWRHVPICTHACTPEAVPVEAPVRDGGVVCGAQSPCAVSLQVQAAWVSLQSQPPALPGPAPWACVWLWGMGSEARAGSAGLLAVFPGPQAHTASRQAPQVPHKQAALACCADAGRPVTLTEPPFPPVRWAQAWELPQRRLRIQ